MFCEVCGIGTEQEVQHVLYMTDFVPLCVDHMSQFEMLSHVLWVIQIILPTFIPDDAWWAKMNGIAL